MQGSRRVPLGLRRPALTFWLLAIAVVVVDQLTKSVARVLWSSTYAHNFLDRLVAPLVHARYGADVSLPVVTGLLRLTFVRNEGAAFGLFAGYQPVFVFTSLVVLVAVGVYWRRSRPAAWPLVIALGLVAGGAFGNLIDRALFGRVTDFIEFAFVDFPVFNVADSAIVVGVGMLVGWLLFGPESSSSEAAEAIEDGQADSPAEAGNVDGDAS